MTAWSYGSADLSVIVPRLVGRKCPEQTYTQATNKHDVLRNELDKIVIAKRVLTI